MRFSTIATLFVAGALGAPTEQLNTRSWTHPESGLQVRGLGDQGDGVYLAVFDKRGVADVQFTPMSELNLTAPVEMRSTENHDGLAKRAGTTCSGKFTHSLSDLDAANVQLANNADAQHNYGKHAWGWVSPCI
jgi:hypothetical protein